MKSSILLEVKDLSTYFFTCDGIVKAVQNVSFTVGKGKTIALVGESGCGKSVTALSILRLVPEPPGKIVSGQIFFEGRNLLSLSEKQMQQVRGKKIALIFQEPMTSLNPVYTVGNQIAEIIKLHQRKSARQGWAEAVATLKKVGIAEPALTAKMYPHQLSGGMRQRVLIAMAISCQPQLLIADEPTTALDVTIQAQILDLLDDLQRRTGMSILLITHDLGVVAERADNIAVMYASRIVEKAASQQLLAEPFHPYTQGLLKSLPRLGASDKRLTTISGTVPDPLHFPILRLGSGQAGCKFHPRCRIGCVDKRCQTVEPSLQEVLPGRSVACWYAPGCMKNQI
jgi:peptide/nickel transport system ATP-binding protein/oligopeptide transport system ATP-binding protein